MRNLERLLEKATQQHRKAVRAASILILCETRDEVPGRIDVLIADGKLAEADRARCICWRDYEDLSSMTYTDWVLVRCQNETEADLRRRWAESAARASAALAECIAQDEARRAARRRAESGAAATHASPADPGGPASA